MNRRHSCYFAILHLCLCVLYRRNNFFCIKKIFSYGGKKSFISLAHCSSCCMYVKNVAHFSWSVFFSTSVCSWIYKWMSKRERDGASEWEQLYIYCMYIWNFLPLRTKNKNISLLFLVYGKKWRDDDAFEGRKIFLFRKKKSVFLMPTLKNNNKKLVTKTDKCVFIWMCVSGMHHHHGVPSANQ